jgi:protein-tyrosine phosphatase
MPRRDSSENNGDNNLNFTDIHCHVLPGLDDGPPDIAGSLEMLDVAAKDGISDIFATPHIIPGLYNNNGDAIMAAVDGLRVHVSTGVRLFYGADVRITVDLLERMESREIPTLNGSGYMLVEMPEYIVPPNVDNLIFNLRHRGIIPIITHPERHLRLMHDLPELGRLRDSGALCQITAMSITGGFGRDLRKISMTMIKKGLVDFVASDAHDPKKRSPVLSAAYKEVRKEFGTDISDRIFLMNPQKIVEAVKVLPQTLS